MTQTEQLLKSAADIAKRTFVDPTETAVLAIFHRLCDEVDRAAPSWSEGERETLH